MIPSTAVNPYHLAQHAQSAPHLGSPALAHPASAHGLPDQAVAAHDTLHHLVDEDKPKGPNDKDLFRDTLLRYMGYANELTAAGMNSGNKLAAKLNPAAWTTVFAYGIADAFNHAITAHEDNLKAGKDSKEAKARAASTFGENIIFHTLATWVGPVYLAIKPAGKLTELVFKTLIKQPPRAWPSIVGVALVPFVPKVFDPIVDKYLPMVYNPASEWVLQKYLNRKNDKHVQNNPQARAIIQNYNAQTPQELAAQNIRPVNINA
ncbi:MAG: hypothetical protein VKJ04_03425 [Vampirovibrionales bacterium]|nr:hypothetical protein [Vampirovibrionales bacterium]